MQRSWRASIFSFLEEHQGDRYANTRMSEGRVEGKDGARLCQA